MRMENRFLLMRTGVNLFHVALKPSLKIISHNMKTENYIIRHFQSSSKGTISLILA